jgi:hypothetical protein
VSVVGPTRFTTRSGRGTRSKIAAQSRLVTTDEYQDSFVGRAEFGDG